jgi:hypothetical protein
VRSERCGRRAPIGIFFEAGLVYMHYAAKRDGKQLRPRYFELHIKDTIATIATIAIITTTITTAACGFSQLPDACHNLNELQTRI